MSICFITRRPTTLKAAIERLERWRCKVEPSTESAEWEATVSDPDGNCLHLTGGSHIVVVINRESGMMASQPTGIEDGTTRVMGKAYGSLHANDRTMMTDILDMAVEGDGEYEEIMSGVLPWPEEGEDEATS